MSGVLRLQSVAHPIYHARTLRIAARQARLPPIISSAGVSRNFFTIIRQGFEGWRLTLGRNPVKLSPGLSVYLPVLHQVITFDLRESSINIPNLTGYTSDNVPVLCSGSLFYRIKDSYQACFEVSEVKKNISNIGTSAVRSVLGTFTYDQVIADRNELNKQLIIMIGDSISQWGVECTKFEIQSFQPANREVERQLELQMEAERNRRKQLLDTRAQINVAEGQKQRVILESEGHLEARSNEADAAFKTVVREAEARQQQALMEATAIAQQVEAIARSLTPSSVSESTPENRTKALQTLVELKRLEQLKAIASSQSNSTYFFGDKASLGAGVDGAGGPWGVDYAQNMKAGIQSQSARSAKIGEAGSVVQAAI